MVALDYLRRAGLAVELEGDRLRITPADRITDAHRQYLRDHRAELLAELSDANDPQQLTRASAATTPAPAVGGASEAASEPPYVIRTAATATPEWREARDQYHHHVFACPGCLPPTGRYCQTGAELRAVYNATPWN